MKRVALRALLAVLVFAVVLWAAAPFLSSAPAKTAGTPGEKVWTEDDLTTWISQGHGTLLALWVPRALAVLLGVLFLVQEVLRAERVRHGLLPPPDGLGPTVVATPQQALALGLLWPFGVMLVGAALFDRAKWSDAQKFNADIATSVAAFFPPALLIVLRRLRLGAGRIPRAAAGVGAGLRFACIALMVMLPITLLWAYAVGLRGIPLNVQDVVQRFAQPSDPSQPWVLAVFGVVVAPFTEEAVFRGLLYPSLRARVPGGPLGAAVIVSLLFAAIHGNLMAAVPLFALALVLAWVMERTNSLLACMTVHAIHNAVSVAPMLLRHVQGSAS